jgi:hypothetical protein
LPCANIWYAGEPYVGLTYDGFEARVLLAGRLDGDAADIVREAVRPLRDRTGT